MTIGSFRCAAGRADLPESFVWIKEETFGYLLLGIGTLLWLWVASYLTENQAFWPGWGVPSVMFLLVAACFRLKDHSRLLASRLLTITVLGGTGVSVLAPGDESLAPFLFVPAVLIIGTLHDSRAAFLTALLGSLVIGAARPLGGATFSTPVALSSLALTWLTVLTSWATTRNLYTALHWAWANSEQAERNLEEAREYQGRLAAALRQVEEANYRLERANYALSWARAEADQARRLKAQFAAHVSHELRTPINLIVGFASLMLNNPEKYGGARLPKDYLADLTALHRSARHLQGLIDDILDLSQIDAGEMPVLKDITDVGAVVHEAVATARQLLDRKGLSINVEVARDLPFLYLDRLRIRQVLLNLLNNAVRFTDQGGVTVRAYRDDKHVLVEVADTGVGIKPGDLPKLFEPFHQLEGSPTRGRGGTGLGLAISKRFVKLHGGEIWAESEGVAGKGSTFRFSLPVDPDEGVSWYGLPHDRERRWRLPSAPPDPTVVVLDDDPAVVKLFQRYLDGYLVAGTASQTEAVQLATTRRAHAVITDLPTDEGGIGKWYQNWCRLATQRSVRIIGCPMPSGKRVASSLGLLDYLVKPVSREALLASVRTVTPQARTILVVDDDPQMVRLLCQMLRSTTHRYRLVRAYNGEQALSLMRRTHPDLVLLDLLMPQIDGLTVLEKMRLDPSLAAIPVVAVSARGAVEAICPSAGRTLVLISDTVLPVSRLLKVVQTVLDCLAPSEVSDGPIGREHPEGTARSEASG